MSTDIHEGAVISATMFSGGREFGACIQITSAMPKLPGMGPDLGRFVQAPYRDVVELCRAVVAFDAENGQIPRFSIAKTEHGVSVMIDRDSKTGVPVIACESIEDGIAKLIARVEDPSFEDLKAGIDGVPLSHVPGLLVVVVRRAERDNVFAEGGLLKTVEGARKVERGS